MPKRKTINRLRNDAADLLQKLVKLKAADENGYCRCVTCGRVDHWKNMDGGHFISRKHQSIKLVEEQVNPQCKQCNGFPDYFTHKAYEDFMIERHGGDYVEWLKDEARKPDHTGRPELEELISELKERVRELEKEIA